MNYLKPTFYKIPKFLVSRPKTRVICTIGPSSCSKQMIKKMILSGMSVARLNLSHGDSKFHEMCIANILEISKDIDVPIGILADIPGPKFRIGKINNVKLKFNKGDEIIFNDSPQKNNSNVIQVWPPGIENNIQVGTELLLDDGAIKIKVSSIIKKVIKCEVQNSGILKSNKSLVIPGKGSNLDYFTQETKSSLKFIASNEIDFVGMSYIRSVDDVEKVKTFFSDKKNIPKLISKIELPMNLNTLEEIIKSSDGVMVARGDLGVQIPISKVPSFQKKIINLSNRIGKPVITATQMLESMIESPSPTRAEATDIYNAVNDGTDALMLSAETSIGKYPVESVIKMSEIALEAEKDFDHINFMENRNNEELNTLVDEAISYGACKTAHSVRAKLIIAFTESGSTAGRVASFRPETPILALVADKSVTKKLSITWGIIALPAPKFDKVQDMFSAGSNAALESNLAKNGDMAVLVVGMPIGVPGNTNLMRIMKIPEPEIDN